METKSGAFVHFENIGGIEDVIQEEQFEKAYPSSEYMIIDQDGMERFLLDLKNLEKSDPDKYAEAIEKGRKDIRKLVKRTITTRAGVTKIVWVKPYKPEEKREVTKRGKEEEQEKPVKKQDSHEDVRERAYKEGQSDKKAKQTADKEIAERSGISEEEYRKLHPGTKKELSDTASKDNEAKNIAEGLKGHDDAAVKHGIKAGDTVVETTKDKTVHHIKLVNGNMLQTDEGVRIHVSKVKKVAKKPSEDKKSNIDRKPEDDDSNDDIFGKWNEDGTHTSHFTTEEEAAWHGKVLRAGITEAGMKVKRMQYDKNVKDIMVSIEKPFDTAKFDGVLRDNGYKAQSAGSDKENTMLKFRVTKDPKVDAAMKDDSGFKRAWNTVNNTKKDIADAVAKKAIKVDEGRTREDHGEVVREISIGNKVIKLGVSYPSSGGRGAGIPQKGNSKPFTVREGIPGKYSFEGNYATAAEAVAAVKKQYGVDVKPIVGKAREKTMIEVNNTKK